MNLSWKRIRKSLKKKRNPVDFKTAKDELNQLIARHKEGIITLSYFDESGFNLTPKVPYAWQPIGETLEVSSAASRSFNVLGFVDRDCPFFSFVFEGSINSSIVVASIDAYSKQIEKPTPLIIDNASTHTSHEFNENIEKGEKGGLTIYRTPPYSPELNIIEMVGRKIKYEGLPFSAYDSLKSLEDKLYKVLSNISSVFKINFA